MGAYLRRRISLVFRLSIAHPPRLSHHPLRGCHPLIITHARKTLYLQQPREEPTSESRQELEIERISARNEHTVALLSRLHHTVTAPHRPSLSPPPPPTAAPPSPPPINPLSRPSIYSPVHVHTRTTGSTTYTMKALPKRKCLVLVYVDVCAYFGAGGRGGGLISCGVRERGRCVISPLPFL